MYDFIRQYFSGRCQDKHDPLIVEPLSALLCWESISCYATTAAATKAAVSAAQIISAVHDSIFLFTHEVGDAEC